MPFTFFLRLFFQWLYHPLAFTYDLVAATVSFGRWNDWGREVLPQVHGTRVLEVGHGPGHLQRSLLDLGLVPVGLDESAQMGHLAKTRLHKSGYTKINLVRGVTQSLPFPSKHFDTILSTFPSEYIVDPQTLSEMWRVLDNGGRLVVLPAVWPRNPLLGWLFRVTGQSSAEALEIDQKRLKNPFIEIGFDVEIQTLDVQSGLLMLIIAERHD